MHISELEEIYDTKGDVLRKIEGIIDAIGHTQGIDPWELPDVLIRIGHLVDRLKNENKIGQTVHLTPRKILVT